jgi:chromosome segregation ATPase
MPNSETIESIQATLQPLEQLQGEQTQLETWVNDSFTALEKLHEELTEWQTELARKQTELDLREDALDQCQQEGGDLGERAVQWKRQLDEARNEISQLEEESNEQIQELENSEKNYHSVNLELNILKNQNVEMSTCIEVEKSKSDQQKDQLADEFHELRLLVEKQSLLLTERLEEDGSSPKSDPEECPAASDTSPRSA